MPGNGWLPQSGPEYFAWVNQKLRLLERRAGPVYGEVLGAIDASGGVDVIGAESYVEGLPDEYQIPPTPVPGDLPPPDEINTGDDALAWDVEDEALLGVTETVAPREPSGVGVTSAAYLDSLGYPQAMPSVSWVAPTDSMDSSELTDLAGFKVWYRPDDDAEDWRHVGTVDPTVTEYAFGPLEQGTYYRFTVSAVDRNGNVSQIAPEVRALMAQNTDWQMIQEASIIAGDVNSSHAEVTGTGFYAYAEPPVPGEPPPLAIRMGTSENDLFSITNAIGDTVASISDTGIGAFAGATFDGPVYIDGMPLVGFSGNTDMPVDYPPDGTSRDWTVNPRGIIETYAKGNVQWFGFNTSSNTASIPNGGWLKIFDVGFDLEAGRQYAVNVPPILMTTTSGTGVGLILRYTTDGSLPTETSPILTRDYETTSSLGFASVSTSGRVINGGTTTQSQIRVLGMLYCFSGGAAATVVGGEYITVSIVDLGLTKSAQGNVLNQVSAGGSGGGSPPTAPAPKPYVKTYSSNGWATYRSKNALLRGADGNVGDTGGKLSQGYSSSGSYNGDQQGLWTFPSIQGDVGAGTITKIEAYIYFSHWYNSSGGTAFLRTHNYADNGWPTGSLPAMAASVTSPSWPKPGGRWVTLPNTNGTAYNGGSGSWRSGGIKGFGIGPASSTSTTYYGNANAAAQLRVSYTK